MEVTLNSGKKIKLNLSQIDAHLKIKSFLSKDDKFLLCVNGRAGTGKTTIVKSALNDEYDIAVTAPTHKAKKVIATMTGYEDMTIHKLLGLRPNMALEEFNQQNTLFSQLGKNAIEDFRIIVCDESSMLSKFIVDLIKKTAIDYKVKIIFMGDSNQMPPIKNSKEKEEYNFEVSSVFTDLDIEQITLTKVERQPEGNSLHKLYDSILSNISSSKDMYEIKSNFDEENQTGYKFISSLNEFKVESLKCFKEDILNSKILCFTNSQVRKWNKVIRNEIIKNPESQITVGEILMSYKTVTEKIAKTYKTITENSCEYEVISIIPFSKKEKASQDHPQVILYGNKVKLKLLDDNNPAINEVFILDRNSYEEFYKIENYHGDYAKKQKEENSRKRAWAIYYEFRNQYFLLGDILSDSNGKIKENGEIKLVDKNLDYAYAITVHKSQGSTYKYVFVDKNDLDTNQIKEERNRLSYVAFSRPTNAAFILCK